MDDKQKYEHEQFFAIWCKYEDIANHFNSLIIQIRIKSLALITTVSTISAIYTSKSGVVQWQLFQSALIFQLLFLFAVCILDLGYYNRLLKSSILAIRNLEGKRPKHTELFEPTFSTYIDNKVGGTFAVHSFYVVSLLVFCIAIIYCGYMGSSTS